MKFFRHLLLLSIAFHAKAQTATTIPVQETELATYIPTLTAIKGKKYQLEHYVHSYYKDLAADEIIILLEKEKELNIGAKGELMLFDMRTGNLKWRTNVNSFKIYITAPYIITSERGSTHCYRRTDGKQMWSKTDATIKYVNEAKGILLTDYIRGLNIHTGKTIWQRYLPGKYNWEDVIDSGDSSIIVAAGGLYKINLYTGKGWSSSAITTKDEFDVPNALGIIPSVPEYPNARVPEIENKPGAWRSTTSNIVSDNGTIYYATNKRVLALNEGTGALNWESPLLRKTGISDLAVKSDKVFIMSRGNVATTEGTFKKYDMPYLLWLDAATGTASKQMNIDVPQPVRDVVVTEEQADVLLDSSLYRFNPHNRDTRSPIPHCDSVQFFSFLAHSADATAPSGNWYFVKDDLCEPHNEFEDDAITMFTSDGIYTLKGLFDVYKDSFIPGETFDKDKYVLFYKDGANLIADKQKKLYDNVIGIIFKTPEANKGFIHDNKLYIVDVNSISIIPLSVPQ